MNNCHYLKNQMAKISFFSTFLDISCPGGETPCNGNGQCDLTSGVCTCDEQHQGADCSGKLNFLMEIINRLTNWLIFVFYWKLLE